MNRESLRRALKLGSAAALAAILGACANYPPQPGYDSPGYDTSAPSPPAADYHDSAPTYAPGPTYSPRPAYAPPPGPPPSYRRTACWVPGHYNAWGYWVPGRYRPCY